MPGNRLMAGLVHLLTASGSILGLLALAAVTRGDWRALHILILGTLLIDSVDGSLARRFRVKHFLPRIDGALMDNLVDFVNYSLIPAFVVLLSPLLPEKLRLAGASLILLSSCYQFSQTNAKTEDHFFRGFPSYWNLLVIYLALLETSTMINSLAVIACSVMTFVPIYYIYPSRTPILRKLTLWLALPWMILLLGAVLLNGQDAGNSISQILALISLYYVVYYLILSLFLSFKRAGSEAKRLTRFKNKHPQE